MNFFRDLTGFSILLNAFFFFFYKKLGLICKEVLWLVHFSTLFSDKPKH